MDGLARAAGLLHREIVVGGKPYTLATPRLKDLADLEAQLLARLPDPIQEAARCAKQVPAGQAQAYWDAAFAAAARGRSIRLDDLGQLQSLGMKAAAAAGAFVALRRHHGPEIATLDAAFDWLTAAQDELGVEALAAIRAVTEDQPKNAAAAASL